MEQTDYEVLQNVVRPRGTGITNLSSTLVKREGRLCMYKRSDNVYEVFLVVVQPAATLFGKDYPAHEIYPGNEDFGYTAWCYNKIGFAERKYKDLQKAL